MSANTASSSANESTNREEEIRRKTEEIRELTQKRNEIDAQILVNALQFAALETKVNSKQHELLRKMGELEAADSKCQKITRKAMIMKQKTRHLKDIFKDRFRELREEKKSREAVESTRQKPASSISISMPECEICLTEYANIQERTPRILKCGHTVCEGCLRKMARGARRIWRDVSADVVIKCPFDRTPTALKRGIVHQLPRNQAIIEMIESRKY